MLSTRTPRAFLASLIVGIGILTVACGGSASSASAPPTEAPTPSASATSAPTKAPTASASAAGDVHPVAQALVDQLNADPLITHLDQHATASTGDGSAANSVDLTFTADLSGDDVAFTIAGSAGGQLLDQQFVVVGDDAFVKNKGADWVTVPATTVEPVIASLIEAVRLVDDPADLEFVGVETIGGVELHQFSADDLAYEPGSGGSGTYDSFSIFAEADGTPHSVVASFSATDAAGVDVTGTTDLQFSNWGGPIEIVAPEP